MATQGWGKRARSRRNSKGHLPWDGKSDPAVNKMDHQAAVTEQEGRGRRERLEEDAEASLIRTV